MTFFALGLNHLRAPVRVRERFALDEAAMRQMLRGLSLSAEGEVILLSTFPPHPDWAFGTHQMEQYARATADAARESAVAYADVFAVWQNVLARKDSSSLLANNINHPNDFGHWLYLQALLALEF